MTLRRVFFNPVEVAILMPDAQILTKLFESYLTKKRYWEAFFREKTFKRFFPLFGTFSRSPKSRHFGFFGNATLFGKIFISQRSSCKEEEKKVKRESLAL